MTLVISKVFTYDDDAATYIQAVEAADAQALEPATRKAINNFVIGCKQDGIWTAIKASCILSGARTLAGALVPLVGTAPTNNNFVSGDYNRKTGLVGNGSTKYLNSNRNNNADPQNNRHGSVYVSAANSATNNGTYIGASGTIDGMTDIRSVRTLSPNFLRFRMSSGLAGEFDVNNQGAATGFIGAIRSLSTTISARYSSSSSSSGSVNSATPTSDAIRIFSRTGDQYSDARLAFYSIGESLDLAKLDTRVTDLINAFAAAIP